MPRVRRHIAFLFVFLLVFISLPKELIHHCQRDHVAAQHSQNHDDEGKCAICDFQFSPTEPTPNPACLAISSTSVALSSCVLFATIVVSKDVVNNKAPPCFCA